MLIALIIIALLLLVLIGATVYFFVFALVRRKDAVDFTSSDAWAPFSDKIKEGRAWIENAEHEKVEIKSYDGLTLRGRFIFNGDSKKTIILFHGYHSRGVNDFGCVADFYFGLGYNMLLIDQRAHGESEGRFITFGVKERYDCRSWIEYVNSRIGDDGDVFIDGISMGGVTVLMACGLELPSNVRGVIADCPFTSPYDIFCHILARNYHLPPFPLIYTTDLMSRLVAGFAFKEASTVEAMENNKLPIIFVHGEADDFVPTYMSKKTYEACTSEKYIMTVPGADHGMSYLMDMENAQAKLKEFLSKYSTV